MNEPSATQRKRKGNDLLFHQLLLVLVLLAATVMLPLKPGTPALTLKLKLRLLLFLVLVLAPLSLSLLPHPQRGRPGVRLERFVPPGPFPSAPSPGSHK
jgi:hypothetical protein